MVVLSLFFSPIAVRFSRKKGRPTAVVTAMVVLAAMENVDATLCGIVCRSAAVFYFFFPMPHPSLAVVSSTPLHEGNKRETF